MKKAFYPVILAFAMIIPQFSQAILSKQYSDSNGIHGNGKIVKMDRTVSGFNAISVNGGIDIYIIPGTIEKAVVETDENIQDAIITTVSNGTLKIYCEKSINNSKK